MSLLRLWLSGSAVMLLLALLYEYAPILLPMLAILAGLGLATWAIVSVARRFEPRSRDYGTTRRSDDGAGHSND